MQINVSKFSTPQDKEADRIRRIKEKAGAAIVAIAPEWKQRNLLARSIELTEKISAGGTLTASEQIELDAIKAVWAQVSLIRDASNQAEANGTLVKDFNP